jgi:hypothetical protein
VLHNHVATGHGELSDFHLDKYDGEVPRFDCVTDFRHSVRVSEAENEEVR